MPNNMSAHLRTADLPIWAPDATRTLGPDGTPARESVVEIAARIEDQADELAAVLEGESYAPSGRAVLAAAAESLAQLYADAVELRARLGGAQ